MIQIARNIVSIDRLITNLPITISKIEKNVPPRCCSYIRICTFIYAMCIIGECRVNIRTISHSFHLKTFSFYLYKTRNICMLTLLESRHEKTVQLISDFVFATRIEQPLYLLKVIEKQ